MEQLAFPPFHFRVQKRAHKTYIFDRIRKKFVVLNPEEWVRQHVLHFLIDIHDYPKNLIGVEKQIKVHQTLKRYDIVIFKPSGKIFMLIECKAPSVKITQETFDQIARYNINLQSEYLMITNGKNHYYCQMDYENKCYHFLENIPLYK